MKADRKKVERIMARAHMTVGAVGRAAGRPPQTTPAHIIGMNVHPHTRDRIAPALGVSVADIAYGVELVPKEGWVPPVPAGQVRVDVVRFAEAVARSGLTLKRLAELAGVTPGTVCSIKRGGAHKAETVDKLADALGVTAEDLIKRGRKP